MLMVLKDPIGHVEEERITLPRLFLVSAKHGQWIPTLNLRGLCNQS